MIAQTRAELLKLRSTRTTLGLVLGMAALIVFIALLTGLLTKPAHLASNTDQRNLFDLGSITGLFSALAGTLLITSEYRYGTIHPTFLFTPRRSRVVVSKLLAGAGAGLVFALTGTGLAFALGYVCLKARGIPIELTRRDITLLLVGAAVAVALWGMIGVAVGTIVRNQVGSIIGLLAWIFVAESLLFAFAPSVGRYSPSEAENALLGARTAHLLTPLAGAGVLLAWTAVLAICAVTIIRKRDVT